MTGISSVLDIAKQALSVSQYALSVTGQNIANVDNTTYSRQVVGLSSTGTLVIDGLAYGTGVEITEVKSVYDETLETYLNDQRSSLSAYEEMATKLSRIEDIFSLGTDSALDTLLSDFWNSWADLADTPSGTAERDAVYESAEAIIAGLNTMGEELTKLSATLNSEIKSGVNSINTLTAQIADLNRSIVTLEAQGSVDANDLRDQRAVLVSDLSELLNISTYEQSNGSLVINTASGSTTLVSNDSARPLSVTGGRIMWESTGGEVDITEQITGGSMGGWLDIRDETIPKYQAELDTLVDSLVWSVNYQHSQGVGLTYFSEAVTGTYEVDGSGLMSTLEYADKVDTDGAFKVWVADTGTEPVTYTAVEVDLSNLAPDSSSTMDVSGTANSVGDTYVLTVEPPGESIGGTSAVTVSWTSAQGSGSFTVAANDTSAVVEVDGIEITFSGASGPFEGDTFVITTDADGVPTENVSDYTLSDFADDFNTAMDNAMTAAGYSLGDGVRASVVDGRIVFTPSSSDYQFAFGDDGDTGYEESGLAAALGVNTFFTGNNAYDIGINERLSDTNNIAAGQVDSETGECASGSNANALLLAECGDITFDIATWTFERGGTAFSSSMNIGADGYFETMVSNLGITSASVERNLETAETLMSGLQDRRDSVSAVSLDEEMINLTKYQNAYNAASKLLSIANEMLDTLLSTL